MSGIGEYLRLTAAELEQVKRDPVWAWNHMEDVREGEEATEPEPGDALYYHTYTAWPLLELLLRRSGFPVDVSRGEQPVRYPDPQDGDYRYLTADQVGTVARELAGLPYDRLAAHADPQELVEAGLCRHGWDGPRTLEWARHLYDGLVEFFGGAAREGHAVLVWQL
ncbi:YfbM family protein [Streptomyces sp. NPDC000410]|uniref:YfbM family protein n=1 Tax=Streptomyces sp. NPDC000410 TaxID=3154254 RepID=UPI00331A206E